MNKRGTGLTQMIMIVFAGGLLVLIAVFVLVTWGCLAGLGESHAADYRESVR